MCYFPPPSNGTLVPYNIATTANIPKGRFHIFVDPSLCMAFGSCEKLAPGVFIVEKDELILATAETCTTKAIVIIDRLICIRIYP
jgi:hypothetical protein